MPPFLKLLRDSEAEVRVAAAGKVACIGNILEADTVGCHTLRACCPFNAASPDATCMPHAGNQSGAPLRQGAGC